jgi:hypothetical protein
VTRPARATIGLCLVALTVSAVSACTVDAGTPECTAWCAYRGELEARCDLELEQDFGFPRRRCSQNWGAVKRHARNGDTDGWHDHVCVGAEEIERNCMWEFQAVRRHGTEEAWDALAATCPDEIYDTDFVCSQPDD